MKKYWEALGQNEYGEILKNQVRFESFKPDNVTNREWEYLLGDDVNNYRHMEHTAGIAAWYIYKTEELGRPVDWLDEFKLMQTAWTHDFAEAIDGDVPDPEKEDTEEAKRLERLSFNVVAKSVGAGHLTEGVMAVTQGRDKMSRDFRAIEVMGYMLTGLRAEDEAHNLMNRRPPSFFEEDRKREGLINSLLAMSSQVIQRSMWELSRNHNASPVVNHFLDKEVRHEL